MGQHLILSLLSHSRLSKLCTETPSRQLDTLKEPRSYGADGFLVNGVEYHSPIVCFGTLTFGWHVDTVEDINLDRFGNNPVCLVLVGSAQPHRGACMNGGHTDPRFGVVDSKYESDFYVTLLTPCTCSSDGDVQTSDPLLGG
eukprot:8359616-Pyramimonas_sp.AAC.1